MQMEQILLAVSGLCILAVAFGNLKGSVNRLVIYRNVVEELDTETRKKYQKSIFLPYTLLGLCIGALSIALPSIRDTRDTYIAAAVMIPVLVGSFIWLFICNKKYLGRFIVPKLKRLFK